MTMESFRDASGRPPRTLVRRAGACQESVDLPGAFGYPFRPFPGPVPASSASKAPEPTRRSDAREHPSRLSDFEGPLRLRGDLGDPLDGGRPAPGHLLQLPPVLHRQAEADRHPGPHRSVPEEVRELPQGAAEEGQGRRRGEEARREVRKDERGGAEARRFSLITFAGARVSDRAPEPNLRVSALIL